MRPEGVGEMGGTVAARAAVVGWVEGPEPVVKQASVVAVVEGGAVEEGGAAVAKRAVVDVEEGGTAVAMGAVVAVAEEGVAVEETTVASTACCRIC